jgi:hypothetical protein
MVKWVLEQYRDAVVVVDKEVFLPLHWAAKANTHGGDSVRIGANCGRREFVGREWFASITFGSKIQQQYRGGSVPVGAISAECEGGGQERFAAVAR